MRVHDLIGGLISTLVCARVPHHHVTIPCGSNKQGFRVIWVALCVTMRMWHKPGSVGHCCTVLMLLWCPSKIMTQAFVSTSHILTFCSPPVVIFLDHLVACSSNTERHMYHAMIVCCPFNVKDGVFMRCPVGFFYGDCVGWTRLVLQHVCKERRMTYYIAHPWTDNAYQWRAHPRIRLRPWAACHLDALEW